MLVYASGQCMEQRTCGCSQLWHSSPPGMAVGCCELRLRSTPRYRLVCICFPTPGRGLPYGSGLGLYRCLGPGECLHSFIHLGIWGIIWDFIRDLFLNVFMMMMMMMMMLHADYWGLVRRLLWYRIVCPWVSGLYYYSFIINVLRNHNAAVKTFICLCST